MKQDLRDLKRRPISSQNGTDEEIKTLLDNNDKYLDKNNIYVADGVPNFNDTQLKEAFLGNHGDELHYYDRHNQSLPVDKLLELNTKNIFDSDIDNLFNAQSEKEQAQRFENLKKVAYLKEILSGKRNPSTIDQQKKFMEDQQVLGVDEPSGLLPEDYNKNLRLEAYLQAHDVDRQGPDAPFVRKFPEQSKEDWEKQTLRDKNALQILKQKINDRV